MWIALMIIKRIPTDVVAEAYGERDQRRPPPAAMTVELAARTPGPIVVVVDPTAVVIRRPTPGLLAHPGPTVRRNPNPAAIAIRSPIVIVVYDSDVRAPNPAVVVNVGPIAVGVEIFS